MKKIVLLSICVMILAGCGNSGDKILQNTPIPSAQSTETPTDSPAPTAEIENISNLSTKVKGWGFVRKKRSAPEVPVSYQEELQKYGGYYLGDTNQKEIYLTFDEGYENGYTAKILDVLRDNNVPAAFFVTGPYLEGQQELVQ